jgi:nitrate reductase NapE
LRIQLTRRNRVRKSEISRSRFWQEARRFLQPYRAEYAMHVDKRRELTVFIFLTLILAPILAVVIVAGYGFLVWMYQIIAGPPSV